MTEYLVSASKALSYLLRHHPESAGLTLDEHGWADVDELIECLPEIGYEITRSDLENIVETDNKKRYMFGDDGNLIRACQGHSIPVDVELDEEEPPEKLWHGTAERFTTSIETNGLNKMSRLYVHLSGDIETARIVGTRHGEPVVYEVDTGAMYDDGFSFYLSANGVWLTEHVPPCYLERIE